MSYRIVLNHYIIADIWGGIGTYPAIVAATDLHPDGPDQAGRIQRLIDVGAVVAIPEAE